MLRQYQQDAVSAVLSFLRTEQGNPLIVAPTGSGKSWKIAYLCKEVFERYGKLKILILAHRKELLEQNAEKLLTAWPDAPLGIYSAGLKSREVADITIAGIQSAFRVPEKFGKVNLVICDEVHLVPKSGTGMYLSLLSKLKEASPHIRMVGLTATPFRLDSGLLHAGDDKIFDAVAYEIGIRELIDAGYLSKLRTKKSKVQADCSDLHKRGGEFIAGEIELVMNRFDLIKRAVSEVVKHGEGRTSWLLFCAGIEHTKNVLKELRAQGINAEMVIGATPSEERARILADFKARKIQALCNCDVLTTGFDAPNIDLIALLRPTCSAGLYVQMVGRGSRLFEGKQDCMILDFAGNIDRFGPLDSISIKTNKGDRAEVKKTPTKTCPSCEEVIHAATLECPSCGFEQVGMREPKHDTKASDADLFQVDKTYAVTYVNVTRHKKEGKPDSVKVAYYMGTLSVYEFLCFDHGGFAAEQARKKWREIAMGSIPLSVEEALSRREEVREPSHLTIYKDKGFWRIRQAIYGQKKKDEREGMDINI